MAVGHPQRFWGDRVDGLLYAAWTALFIGLVGAQYLDAMFTFTGGRWSAPLDDTFIHFDFARSLARGRFFEWSPGDGFSSGTTSVTYPIVLAIGYRAGLTSENLMGFALGVAGLSLFVFCMGAARLFAPLGPWAKYLVPPALFSVGFLNWTFASGMETAFFLGVWGVVWWLVDRWLGLPPNPRYPSRLGARGIVLSAVLAMLALTRPEALVVGACFVLLTPRDLGWSRRAALLVGPVLAVGAWSLVSWVFTGEAAQAGSIAKLVWFDPFLTTGEKIEEIAKNLHFIAVRTTWHHFSSVPPLGLVPVGLALAPLVFARTRLVAAVMWLQIVVWSVLVAQNGHVRFQNERYLAAPAALLLVLAALGAASLLAGGAARSRAIVTTRAAAVATLVASFWFAQQDNQRFQRWFFGRACQNIAAQQLTVGERLRARAPSRVFVGDAGAITYASDSRGLDGIGLGGYGDLPFAAAYRHGVGATLELIERMPPDDRPDHLALYRSWWGELPDMFGQPLFDVTIQGNVICGDSTKSVYRADWWALDRGGEPQSLGVEHVVEDLDLADLVSERAHGYAPIGAEGRAAFAVRPLAPRVREAFDGTRVYAAGQGASFDFTKPPGVAPRLVLRVDASEQSGALVYVGDELVQELEIEQAVTWVERDVPLPEPLPEVLAVRVVATNRLALGRVWLVTQAP